MERTTLSPVPTSVEILDDPRLDRIFRLAEVATQGLPLPRVLRNLCASLADLLPADIVSVYLRENDDEGDVLVMRANVGFPEVAIGNVCLPVGEGITGFAAECMRPVQSEQAATDAHFKAVDGLDEDRFPAFLAWPLVREGRGEGVLVVQRPAHRPFSAADQALTGAAASAFVLALEAFAHRVHRADWERGSSEGREVRLHGVGMVKAVALGRAEPLPTLRDLVGEFDDADLEAAFAAVQRHVERAMLKLSLAEDTKAGVARATLVLQDARFRSELRKEVARRGLAAGLAALARRYALTASRTLGADDWLEDRASEVAALCRMIAAHVADRPLCRQGSVMLLPERPGSLLALEAAARRAQGVVVGDPLPEARPSAQILRAAEIATVSEVAGLFDWVRPDDPMLVDGVAGVVWVNPSEVQIGRLKA